MKLSSDTIAALHELSKVSPTVLLCRDGDLFALDGSTTLRATAHVPDRFPRDVAFEDIRPFLEMLVDFGPPDTDVSFDSKTCRLTALPDEASFVVAIPQRLSELLRHKTEKSDSRLHTRCEFTYRNVQLCSLQKVVKLIKKKASYEMRLASDGKTASLAVQLRLPKAPQKTDRLESIRQMLSACPETFAFEFPTSVLSALPIDNYDGLIAIRSKGAELRLTAQTRPITYSCFSVSTVETPPSKAPSEA